MVHAPFAFKATAISMTLSEVYSSEAATYSIKEVG